MKVGRLKYKEDGMMAEGGRRVGTHGYVGKRYGGKKGFFVVVVVLF